MAGKTSNRSAEVTPTVQFKATLHRPAPNAKSVPRSGAAPKWTFLRIPIDISVSLPSRALVPVEGTLNGSPFAATLEPDGDGGHWFRVEEKLRKAAGAKVGDIVALAIVPVAPDSMPEPAVPPDLRRALGAAPLKTREAWSDITPAARRDFIHWITSPKRPETRAKRIETACDMLAKGKRRPCCFDRSGMYSKSLACPVAADTPAKRR